MIFLMIFTYFLSRYGIHLNREIEVNFSHRNYVLEYGPRRHRLAHSMLFEEFEIICENWMDLQEEFKEKGKNMLEIAKTD